MYETLLLCVLSDIRGVIDKYLASTGQSRPRSETQRAMIETQLSPDRDCRMEITYVSAMLYHLSITLRTIQNASDE